MTDNRRESTKAALFAYLDKSERERKGLNKSGKQKKVNDKPEKRVEKDCTDWLNKNGFDGQVYESKAKCVNGVWTNAGMKFGTADWGGVSPYGEAVYVEFKALGKLSTFWKSGNERQQDFLISKIDKHAFAVVVDSVTNLDRLFTSWRALKMISPDSAKQFLIKSLPPKPKKTRTR